MTTSNMLHKKNGQYLWFSLLGLGFRPDTATNNPPKRVNLGVSMFDKPNKEAFYLVSRFLLRKLNPTRFQEAYRHCWPILDHKNDAEFRKITCVWLKEIMNETANAGSKVVPSLFISPGGPKFLTLMLDLTQHVMLQEMKTFTTDNRWIPEAAAVPTSSYDMAVKRYTLVRNRFFKGVADQDHFLQEYQRRAQLHVKTMKELKAEGAKYDDLLRKQSCDSTEGEEATAEKVQKVRSLWSTINGMMSEIKEGQNAVECVLKGDVDQYVLDGTDRVLKIPPCLLERIEQLPHQLKSGNLYEAGQLNLLCVMELMNHALQILKERRPHVSDSMPSAQLLQDKCHQMSRMLQDLHLIRQKISKEEIPQRKSAIKQMEEDWDRKWQDTLKETPLVSFLNEDPALGFLSPMAPLSFEPAGEASYTNGVFSQYPAKLLEEKLPEGLTQDDAAPDDFYPRSSQPAAAESPESPTVVCTEAPRSNTSLDWLLNTSPSPPPKTKSLAVAPQTSSKKMEQSLKMELSTITQTGILEMECENLAEQFADAVITTTPSQSQEKGLELEALLQMLQKDPFSTRKQLPRTPESLIQDVKSSWRKAIQEDEAQKKQPSVRSDCLTELFRASHGASPALSLQGALHQSLLSWDSSALHLSIDQETLPEIPGSDSFLNLSDDDDDDDLLISPPSPIREIRQACNDGLALISTRTPECLQTSSDLLAKLQTPAKSTNRVFSLDLEELEKVSPVKKQDYSLPTLITFSPIDEDKC